MFVYRLFFQIINSINRFQNAVENFTQKSICTILSTNYFCINSKQKILIYIPKYGLQNLKFFNVVNYIGYLLHQYL